MSGGLVGYLFRALFLICYKQDVVQIRFVVTPSGAAICRQACDQLNEERHAALFGQVAFSDKIVVSPAYSLTNLSTCSDSSLNSMTSKYNPVFKAEISISDAFVDFTSIPERL